MHDRANLYLATGAAMPAGFSEAPADRAGHRPPVAEIGKVLGVFEFVDGVKHAAGKTPFRQLSEKTLERAVPFSEQKG